jgi:hypothetical protein
MVELIFPGLENKTLGITLGIGINYFDKKRSRLYPIVMWIVSYYKV